MTVEMIKEAAANFGTPSYVFDLDLLKERVDLINKYIGKKANESKSVYHRSDE